MCCIICIMIVPQQWSQSSFLYLHRQQTTLGHLLLCYTATCYAIGFTLLAKQSTVYGGVDPHTLSASLLSHSAYVFAVAFPNRDEMTAITNGKGDIFNL